MSTLSYKCPGCGSGLVYGAAGKMTCPACSSEFDLEAIEALYTEPEQGRVDFDLPQAAYQAEEAAQLQAYHCKNCGAELVTEGTTTATECPYCGSPAILPDRIEGGVRPEMVVPFVVTREQAQQQFQDYFKGKALLPNVFLQGANSIAEIRKLYVPYWLFDCDARAHIVYDAEKRHTERTDEWEIERVEHYLVRRGGTMRFENIPVDGSVKLDDAITESLEPYDLDAAVPFQPAVLSGAMADHADVDAEACEARAVERVETSIASAVRDTVHGYSSVRERSKSIQAEGGKVTPVLLPVWLITTIKEGRTYTFAINGQTGKLTCDVPADGKKSFAWGAGVFAGTMGIAALMLALMDMLSGAAMLIAGIVALIIALVVVAVLTGQLKQAAKQDEAQGYAVEGGLKLFMEYDHYLYTHTNRRRIEKKEESASA